MTRPALPSFALARAGFVQPGEICAEVDAGVSAWLARIAGQAAAGAVSGGARATAGLWMAPAGAEFVRAA